MSASTVCIHPISSAPKNRKEAWLRNRFAAECIPHQAMLYGLALRLTRKLVEFQHGQISVQSAPGLGSTFTVVLPLHEMQEAAAST